MTETAKVKARLATLASSVDDLDELLEPLFAQSLPESVMALEPIQQAKLQTVLPYLVYDLIFIYLKARGIDPKSHPVVSELDRVKQYFEKIINAEKSENMPTTKLDKEAAGRFIKNAIAQASKPQTQIEPAPSAGMSTPVPVKVTNKMIARAEYERQLKEEDPQFIEEEELEVIGEISNADGGMSMDVDKPAVNVRQASLDTTADKDQTRVGRKRRRPVVDPFTGYGEATSMSDHDSQSQATSCSNPRSQGDVNTTYQNSASSSIDEMSPSLSKSQNSKKKKKSKKYKDQL